MQAAVLASMRNEGPFIVEWVAWYRMLGFSTVAVVTNDCTDHSPAYLGMSINWRVFGTSGRSAYEDRPVHWQFVYASSRAHDESRFVKSIFRQPRRFGKWAEHSPTRLNLAKFARAWGEPGMAWVNSAGRPLKRWAPIKGHMTVLPPALVTHQVAQVNHYKLRSAESFNLKRGTLSPVALTDRYTQAYFEACEAGREVDTSAFRYSDAFDAEYARAMALPGVARLHALCCADHVKAIVQKAGGRAEADPRYQEFIAEAARLA